MKRKHALYQIDWWLLAPVIFLIIISLTILFSINSSYFYNQLFVFLLSLFVFFIFSQIRFDHLSLPWKYLYFISIALLVLVLIIGFEARGAVRWIDVLGFSLQLSEVLKPVLSISFAVFLSLQSNRSFKSFILVLFFLTPIVLLIHLQPDLGTALIYVGVVLMTLILYGMPLRWFVLSFVPFLIASPFIWSLLHDYQKRRILTFLNPMADPQGSSYNLIQAVIAVGSGMFLGKGIQEGTQSQLRFLPENHTDFIFASLAEKLGFLGTGIVIIAFVALLLRIYFILIRTKQRSEKIFLTCSFFFILIHFFVNIGMNLGLVPVVGVTLPFVSYGGSSLLTNFITLGIISSISVANRTKETLEIR